ncbi:5-dehydro-4-deoxy-D-glucuronate isomerase [Rhizobium sp. FKL33]|uniref:5-dehydro-4-deoxy-D-glucuronate isomerase n=1 Tax=Rhizobium sp. FKL33 TaxID=2562307 RepID=UPI0010C01034|nr:5-dehydro-4-deoxy-D-glucuronate isomerase [Rhizobium sp. FKL33]
MTQTPLNALRHAVHFTQAEQMGTHELREAFLVEQMFRPGEITATYTHYDRMLVLGVQPAADTQGVPAEVTAMVGSATLLERRELGLVNIGGPARVTVDGAAWEVGPFDALYIGMGAKELGFASVDPANPAKLYGNSAPAHAAHPTRLVRQSEAIEKQLGSPATSNERKLFQYLHPDVLPTCQLLMGMTRLATGSVWNTMPAHTHDRRMEAYLYFDIAPEAFVLHLMGRPEATRHLVVRNEEVVLSPPWSVHCGAGTGAYSFIWSMAGDNQSFTDMDMVPMGVIR